MNEEKVYDGFHKIIKVKALMKGKEVWRERLVLKSAVAAFMLDENDRMALVTQFRPVPNVYTMELPAGLLDKEGLTPLETLIEEISEECHLGIEDILECNEKPIYEYYMTVGSSDAKLKMFEFKVKEQKELEKEVDDVDVDKVGWYTFEEVENFIREGKIQDNKTLLAFNYWTIKRLKER